MFLSLAVAYAADPTISQVDRVEIDAGARDDWNVVPLGGSGLLLVGNDDRGDAFTFARYDTTFKQLWTVDWSPEDRSRIEGTWIEKGNAWFLLHGRGAEFTLLGVDLETGSPSAQTLTSPMKKTKAVGGLLVQGTEAWLTAAYGGPAAYFTGLEGSLLHVDLPTSKVVELDVAGAVGADRVMLDALVASKDGVTAVAKVDEKRHRTLYMLDVKGATLGAPLAVAPPEADDTNLLTARRVSNDASGAVVVGTYASGERSGGVQGMYLAKYEGGKQAWLRYHSFVSFEHFFDYLPEATRERLQKRIDRKADKGEELDLGYMLTLHTPMIIGDRAILVGEAFYPQYHSVTTTSTVNGVTSTTTRQVFDGWRYTHATVAAFDAKGERLWDASFPIGNVLSPTIREQVAVSVIGDRVRMLYCVAGKVYSLEATANGAQGEKAEQRLMAEGEDATVKTSWDSHAAWWYDDWFLLWGYERVKEAKKRRTVFAFSKVGPGKE